MPFLILTILYCGISYGHTKYEFWILIYTRDIALGNLPYVNKARGGQGQVCSNKGYCPSRRGGNSKRVKIHWTLLEISSRTSRPKSIKNYLWVKGIQFCSIKGRAQVLFKGEIITKNVKIEWSHLEIFFKRTLKPEKMNFTWKLSDLEQRQIG
jgi:hypothetical protein